MRSCMISQYQKSNTQLFIRSYELGVLFVATQVRSSVASLTVGQDAPLVLAQDGCDCAPSDALLVPLPYDMPLTRYTPQGGCPSVSVCHSSTLTPTLSHSHTPFCVCPSRTHCDVDEMWVWDRDYAQFDSHGCQWRGGQPIDSF